MINHSELNKFIYFWDKFLLGKDFGHLRAHLKNPEDIKNELYRRTLMSMPEVLNATGFDSFSADPKNTLEFVREVFEKASKVSSESCSFYPRRIKETKKATCAGNALLVNAALAAHNIPFEYGRPARHSINFVRVRGETWWLDGTNRVFEKIEYKDEMVDGVKIRRIKPTNQKIYYRLAILHKPRDVIFNLIGNTHAMNLWAYEKTDDIAVEIMKKDGKLVQHIDFEKWMFYLYPKHMHYVMHNKEYLEESKRIKKWENS